MQLYSQDIRDIIRIGGPTEIIGQGVAAISSNIAKLPTLLSGKQELPLTPLVADMQAGLTERRQADPCRLLRRIGSVAD